jgi:hypothetical protein
MVPIPPRPVPGVSVTWEPLEVVFTTVGLLANSALTAALEKRSPMSMLSVVELKRPV